MSPSNDVTRQLLLETFYKLTNVLFDNKAINFCFLITSSDLEKKHLLTT